MTRTTLLSLVAATALSATTAAAGPIADRIATTAFTLPASLASTSASFCLGGYCSISPRLYLAPRSDGSHWLGWTGSDGSGRVSLLANGTIAATFTYTGEEVRGLVAHDDGSFALLLRRIVDNSMRLTRRSAADASVFSTALANTVAIAQMNTGDSRLAYGNSRYAAYFAVHGISGNFNGHEGDQLSYVSSTGASIQGGWNWGCSHQLAGLVGYHPGMNAFGAICLSDCYASKGVLFNNGRNLFPIDAACNGTTYGQFGQLANGDSAWKLAFVAQDRPGYPARGVGFLSFTNSASVAPTIAWLTNTNGTNERDPVLARIGSATPERFLAGWREGTTFRLGIVDTNGAFVTPAETVAGISWGDRDDSLRSAPGSKVAWAAGTPGTRIVKLHVYATPDAIFSGGFE
ncbi:MAG TPA: hypothetical protein VLF18_22120 [Tahibacter sp.]|uniref:hypothetical protein n=1 Tax=Tahibacter sp. TaxID=2056211 RepID=UPI002C8DD8A5|nr:hypothetical protein [Tahibacter sp.]HSX62890.1 hypothetical protein [Tahibacter sp.]